MGAAPDSLRIGVTPGSLDPALIARHRGRRPPALEAERKKAFNPGALADDNTREVWWNRRRDPSAAGGIMPKTLLLADDSVTIQKVVGLSFANEDVSLLTVDNGDDAIAQVRSAHPDIVLADVVMPGKNGYEVCEAIKSDPAFRHIPVLLLTGTFEAFDEERARRVGADGHITKPFEAQALVDTVNGLLAKRAKPAAQPAPAPATPAPGPTRAPAASAAAAIAPGGSAVPVEEEAYDFFDDELLNEGELGLADPQTEAQHETTGDGQRTMLLDRADPGGEAFELGEEAEVGLDFGEPTRDAARSQTGAPLASSAPAPTRPLTETAAPHSAPEATVALFADDPDGPWQSDPVQQGGLEDELSGLEVEDTLGATGGGASATVAFFEDEPVPVGRSVAASTGAVSSPRLADDPLTRLDPDDLARETVLDPAAGRGHDVSWSDLGDPLAAPDPGASMRGMSQSDHTPTAPTLTQLAPPRLTPPARVVPEASVPAPQAPSQAPLSPEPFRMPAAPAVTSSGLIEPVQMAGASRPTTPDISPVMRQRIHDTLEKVAWEAFSDLSDTIVRQVLERFEAIAWEVIPQMAEALVREEIRRMKGEEE
ncbi:MAG TPA: response regulator [Myxococcota bacterium]|nr:response regulator [Myxococcota bacterium]